MSRKCFQWSVYLVDFPSIGGNVQEGKRPAICISNDTFNVYANVGQFIPLTSQEKVDSPAHCTIYPSDYPFLRKESTILVEQINTLPTNCVISFLGRLKSDDIYAVKETLRRHFLLGG